MKPWEELISDRKKRVYAAAGYGKQIGLTNLGRSPAVLVIDVTTNFIGDRPEPILESIKRFPNSCGEEGWEATYRIKELLEVARKAAVPIIYSMGDPDPEEEVDTKAF